MVDFQDSQAHAEIVMGTRIWLKIIIDEIRSSYGVPLRIATHHYEESGRPLAHANAAGECLEIEGQCKTHFRGCEKQALDHRMSIYESERWLAGLRLTRKDIATFINTLVVAVICVEIAGAKYIDNAKE